MTVLLIGANVAAFAYPYVESIEVMKIYYQYGLIPYNLTHHPAMNYTTVFSSMFIHSGITHLLGNMLFLWIFGNNIEDTFGKFNFVIFYLMCGVIAAVCHIAIDTNSHIPMVGASGAVSGVLGAYMVLFPRARVRTLIFLGFFVTIVRVPAMVLLGLWLLIQIANGIYSSDGASIAWYAHIGGFVAGMVFSKPFQRLR